MNKYDKMSITALLNDLFLQLCHGLIELHTFKAANEVAYYAGYYGEFGFRKTATRYLFIETAAEAVYAGDAI